LSFSLDIASFAKETGLELELVTRKIALDAYTRVTIKTPVDTGRARANWNIGAGSPDLGVTEDTSKPSPNLAKGDGDDAIFITNNLEYVHELENGSSKKAPDGMVAITMLELEAGIRNVLR